MRARARALRHLAANRRLVVCAARTDLQAGMGKHWDADRETRRMDIGSDGQASGPCTRVSAEWTQAKTGRQAGRKTAASPAAVAAAEGAARACARLLSRKRTCACVRALFRNLHLLDACVAALMGP